MTDLPARRLLLVHAHPDDESINNGATMAKYAAEGALVTLVTCTRGEEGEVVPPALAHLAPDRDDRLGPHRVGELAAAMRELGVTDHRFLGGPGRFRDSGMAGLPQNHREDAFWSAPVDAAAAHLVGIVREVRPQVLVTYDPDGGYGHPDHVQAHRVAVRAAELAADPSYAPGSGAPHTIAKTYWNRISRSAAEEGFAALRAAGGAAFPGVAGVRDLPGVVDDELVTTEIDGTAYADRKTAAMRAHATQITVRGRFFALSNGLAQPVLVREQYQLVRGVPGAPAGERETDLFAGVAA
ncbi:N-acetyl-1-D-myo-inositol-2-amino-2-deoxy-alpha-D-glucopyranoside deacetylase [Streptomyces somaliensis DSM 40738]|uniref:1D-myo-inositol 2-acetamido-2-deoxy-alpha-D-glucopyranoside deacetylase n=1 Tax=Streptomyces somaliensis (strain ATCC 33201 / DSM 40738 / JCM 12659 / KCTC 9044 / NCTC 11332 / NRRL B-12077 / IP 733) TaxID=1134445 RepID=A0AA44DHH6_STRE0|nr:N-acetyl-1-D-myo-inositol-2-amino-2-deoxy-alpha-D-glucopyranoside deacetylase [Streptomyces somaliensis]MCQ0023846.1 N-acetyl-1-D-myo-inositol-2-amino-2-deoxy-alpha-D-glucopyranoside deacetylase [Streptomyces somaliensis DSM 40738]NKY16593.1 N-acetyl-1-D-myo-inositol-2-amino-2-deoxy-alpha-D-glucopyranoside deacetylase [Streptomyces somaliensis DSM 40738]